MKNYIFQFLASIATEDLLITQLWNVSHVILEWIVFA